MAASRVKQASEAAQRYASALFTLAQEKGELEGVHKALEAFVAIAKGSDDLSRVMNSPAVSRADKGAALAEIAKKADIHPLVQNFIGTMALNGRAHDVIGAQGAFDELYAKQRGVKRAVVRTASDLNDAERARIEKILAKAVGGEVELTSEVDPSLIGGIQLRIGSQLVDASIAAKLDRMNTAMKGA